LHAELHKGMANPSITLNPPQALREDSDDDMSSTDEEDDAPPALHSRALAHAGGVNRLRAMPQAPGVLAAWADTGAVQARARGAAPSGLIGWGVTPMRQWLR
jgi:hypothetical protein